MGSALTMTVVLIYYHPAGKVYGAPAGFAGDVLTVSFDVGAKLVAAGYAEPAPEPERKSGKSVKE